MIRKSKTVVRSGSSSVHRVSSSTRARASSNSFVEYCTATPGCPTDDSSCLYRYLGYDLVLQVEVISPPMCNRSRRRCGGEVAVAGVKSLTALLAMYFLAVPNPCCAFTVPVSRNSRSGTCCIHRSGVPSAYSLLSNRFDSRLEVATTAPLEVASTVAVDATQDLPNAAAAEEEETKVGVLLLNLGGPETGEDVEGT